jgi:transposase
MQDNKRFARRYDREFKRDAVALVQSGRSIKEVARDLGVSGWPLRHWVRLDKEGQPLKEPAILASETPEQRELRRLLLWRSKNTAEAVTDACGGVSHPAKARC